jgi:DNA-binding CsgD family transcriptional regulator/DNA-binding transcriptional ArsR family regulator
MPDGGEDDSLAVYQALRRMGSAERGDVPAAAGLDQARAEAGLRRLTEVGLTRTRPDGQIEPLEPDTALVRTLAAHRSATEDQAHRSEALHRTTQALLYVYRPAVERVASKVEVEYIRDSASKRRTMAALHATAQRSADSLHLGPLPPMDMLKESMNMDAAMVERGMRLRAIYPRTALQTPKHVHYMQELAGVGVSLRLLEHAPCDMVITDGEVACLPANPSQAGGNPMLLVRSAELVAVLTAVFDDYWLRAVPLEETAAPAVGRAPELTPQERVIIRLMSTGLTDDQIARKMGVHRRTVQRAIAKLMDRLHADTRFEAGLKLAQDPDLSRVLPPNRNRPPIPAR